MTQTLQDNQTLKENWSISEIESLLGLHLADEDKEEPTQLTPDTTQVLSNDEVETKVEGEGVDDAKTKQKRLWLSKNPYAKLILIAFIVGCGALFVGFVLSGATSLNFRGSTVTAANDKKPDDSQQVKPDSLEQRNAQLTGELALSQQKQQMQAIREDLDNRPDDPNLPKPQIEKPSATGQPTTVSPASTASPVTTSSSPTRYSAQHAVSIPPRPKFSSRGRTTQAQSPYSKTRAQPPLSSQTASGDPLEQWQLLAQLGSYGKGNNGNNESGILLAADESDLSPDEEHEQEEHSTQLVNNSSNQLSLEGTLGQVAVGKLITPLVWVQGLGQGEGETFVVHLTQPLTNRQGQEVLPKDSEIIFGVTKVHESGLVFANAIAAVVDGEEYGLAANTLKLRLSDGSPLLATKRDDSGESLGNNLVNFVVGALSKVGELSNRADSTSSYSGAGGSYQSESYGDTNYLGALFEGGLSPLQKQWLERNQQRLQQSQGSSSMWWVEPGTEVQVFVTRSFNLGGVNNAQAEEY